MAAVSFGTAAIIFSRWSCYFFDFFASNVYIKKVKRKDRKWKEKKM